ncbi:MAG: hypothetical protein WBC44_03450 [Planctomycetaceae bacterium]
MSPTSQCPLCGFRGAGFSQSADGRFVCPSCGEVTGTTPPVVDVTSKVIAAGITMAVVGGMTLLAAVLQFAFAVFLMPPPVIPPDLPAEQQGGFLVGYRMAQYALPAISLLLGILQLAGGVQMARLRTWGLCLTSAIASLLPCTCTALFTIPVGIWVILVLKDPAVKARFR